MTEVADVEPRRWWESSWLFFANMVVVTVALNVSINAVDPTLHTVSRTAYYLALAACFALSIPRWRRWQPPWRRARSRKFTGDTTTAVSPTD